MSYCSIKLNANKRRMKFDKEKLKSREDRDTALAKNVFTRSTRKGRRRVDQIERTKGEKHEKRKEKREREREREEKERKNEPTNERKKMERENEGYARQIAAEAERILYT
ncbi:hypothetical protein P170DRAFT_185417 [Aspergillus steynii IBT 23096]|uniref:Uncharacterized protein n=1 Tax=Aspergillus steynii IBT 23096 TaxID=1392250 RepID=A0A2I2G9F5_9EURO|nr:uncharacterized protein P170DRAFT_185417 [Aspergillus steynii IBT 23096]PLB49510.1 hypothetical protein P170DRAFT_185417 [Aspergillus steynii IBT 23096]